VGEALGATRVAHVGEGALSGVQDAGPVQPDERPAELPAIGRHFQLVRGAPHERRGRRPGSVGDGKRVKFVKGLHLGIGQVRARDPGGPRRTAARAGAKGMGGGDDIVGCETAYRQQQKQAGQQRWSNEGSCVLGLDHGAGRDER
jgi:hypothetical protein